MKRIFITIITLIGVYMCSMAQSAPKVIKLLPPTYDEGMTLMQALKNRQSSKGFTEKEISL